MTTALTIDGLTIAYRTNRGRVRAVRELSFEVGPGESVGLIGESGSGKSTVALAIMRLLPPNAEVTGGHIEVPGEPGEATRDVLALTERQLRSFRWAACSLVPQGAISALNPVMRVAEHFEDTAAAHNYLSGTELERRGRDLLSSVRLDADRVWRAYPHELSGGMRQRVLIALALLLSPRLLILDEPTTALDILTQRSILDILTTIRGSAAFSMLFISHDLPVAAEVCQRIVTMYAGRAIEAAPTRHLMTAPRHPYSIALIRAVPSLTGAGGQLAAIPGSPPDLQHLPVGCAFTPRCPLAISVCHEVDPPLTGIAPDHKVACHRWADAESALEWEAAADA